MPFTTIGAIVFGLAVHEIGVSKLVYAAAKHRPLVQYPESQVPRFAAAGVIRATQEWSVPPVSLDESSVTT